MTTVDRALDVLFHLHAAGGPCGVSAIGEALGLPKSSTHRLLAALRRRALVEQDDRGRYRPGIGLVALGLGALEHEPIVLASRPVLAREAAALGETFFLVAARAGRLVVLEKAEGSGFLRAAPRVGAAVPVHATASGKLYLAYAPEQVADSQPMREPLEAYTRHTRTDAARLARELVDVRQAGWAANRDEWIAGLTVIAAPVRTGRALLGAVAVAAATARADELGEPRLVERVQYTAARVAARLQGEAAPGSGLAAGAGS